MYAATAIWETECPKPFRSIKLVVIYVYSVHQFFFLLKFLSIFLVTIIFISLCILGLYQRNLFLEQRYDKESIQRVEGHGKFFNGSALNFTTKPLRYTFKPSIEGSDDNAFIYSGVMSVSTGNFSFEISCTAKCRFTFTKSVSGRAQDVM